MTKKPSQTSITQDLYSQGSIRNPPALLLAIDPGLSTGICWFRNAQPEHLEILRSVEDFQDWLEAQNEFPDVIVMEKYKLFKWLALQQSGSKMEVAQAEGSLLAWARRHKIPVIEQSPQILPIAQKWSKWTLNKNHRESHADAALNHGFYYLVVNNMTEINK